VRKVFLDRLHSEGKTRCEYQAWRKDGTTAWFQASSRLVNDDKGKFLYYESIVEDISDRRHKEVKLKNTAESLTRSNLELNRFAHTVAHDLNEPLRTVQTYSALLAGEYQSKLDPEARGYLDFLVGATSRMKAFVDDILNFSQVDGKDTVVEELDMGEIAREIVQNLTTAIHEVGAQIIIEPLPIVRGDKAKFLRLFQNLISNSLKFRSEAPLVISISATLSGSYWVFCIKDNGMGFDQKNSEKIFELFARVVDREKFSGSGMGLSMCKRIIETQGGRIWAESQPGHGSCFYFTIPSILFDAKGKPQPISLRYT
jgi:light-regulated signal transduction histidine kinase (bacteriophytochrome)